MSDVASLGFAVDSSPIDRGTKSLSDFNQTAAMSETRVRAIEAAAKRTGVSFDEMAARVKASSGGMSQHSDQAKKVEAATKVASQATNELSNAIGGGGGSGGGGLRDAVEKAHGSTSNWLNTLTRRFVLGFIITQLRAMTQAIMDLNREAAKTGDVGRFTGVGGQKTQGIQSVAAVSGIDSGKFLDDFTAFGRQVALAKHGVGDLGTLLRANNIPVKTTEDAFEKVADLVRNSATEIGKFSILQQAGLPATREWVKFMEQGSAAITKAGSEASKLSQEQLEQAARVERRWNELWNNFSMWGKRAVGEVFDSSNWQVKIIPGSITEKFLNMMFGNGIGFNATPKPVSKEIPGFSAWGGEGSGDALRGPAANDAQAEIARLQRMNTQIGLLGDLAKSSQLAQVEANNLRIAFLQQGVGVGAASDALRRMHETYREGAAIQMRAANGIVSADELMQQKKRELAIQVFNGKMTQDQANESLGNYARHAREAAEAAQVYASKFPQLTQAMLDANNTSKQFDQFAVSGLNKTADAMTDVVMGTKPLKQAFKDLSLSIIRDLTGMIIKAQLFKAVSSFMPGLGGLFGGSGSGSTQNMGAGLSASASNPSMFASGGYTGPGQKYDPAGIVHRGEFVFDQSSVSRLGLNYLSRLHKGYADGGPVGIHMGGGGGTSVALNVNVNAGSGDPRDIVKVVRSYVGTQEFAAHVTSSVKGARQGRQL